MTPTLTESKPLVQLTPAAVAEVRAMLGKPENTAKHLRLYVEKGGCSGMQYGMVFDEQRDGDHAIQTEGLTVLVDSFSADYLQGVQVDYNDSLTGGGFKVLNPNARQSCGCGKSFET